MKKKTIQSGKLFNIVFFVIAGLVTLLVLGLVSSLFAGGVSGGVSSGRPSANNPSGNRPSYIETDSIKEETTEPSDESESDSETELIPSAIDHLVNVAGVYIDGEKISSGTKNNNYFSLNLKDYSLTAYDSLSVNGYFMVEGGVSKYLAAVFCEGTNDIEQINYNSIDKSVSDDNGSYLKTATSLGFSSSALKGCCFNFDGLSLESFAGKTVEIHFFALTNENKVKCVFQLSGINVPDFSETESDSEIESGSESETETDNVANEITFTIQDVTCTALEGMTWGEWVNSTYNVFGCYIDLGGAVCYHNDDWVGYEEVVVLSSDIIIAGGCYVNNL